MAENEYEKQGKDFLSRNGLTFSAKHVSKEAPIWCKDNIHGDKYCVTFTRRQKEWDRPRSLTLRYWNSYDDVQKDKKPTPYDVLAAIDLMECRTFQEFVKEYGYTIETDQELEEAKVWFKEYVALSNRMKVFFTDRELEELAEIQ